MDISNIIGTAFSKLVEKGVAKTIDTTNEKFINIIESLKVNFSRHLQDSYSRYSKVRTLLNRDEPVEMMDIYTKTRFFSRSFSFDDADIIQKAVEGVRTCITGSAGSGKSMFMRFLLLQLLENEYGKIPLFIELRHINSIDKKDLLAFMHYNINRDDAAISYEIFLKILKEGSFVVILDGFDEVDLEFRASIERQIIEMGDKFVNAGLIVSSRPDERFSSWSNFRIRHVLPMGQQEVVSLISKLNFNKEVKKKFIENIKSSLFSKHESFLSNPLLATMMLLTYDQFAHIPDKIHLFYEQAFETLFVKHDSSKQAAYQRRFHTELPINDFKNCLSSMCILTYAKEKFEFTESELLDFIKGALKFEKIDAVPQKFLRDLLESVCIVHKDGLYITFTHRSFQEYFSAHFISRSPSSLTSQLLDRMMKRSQDNAITMAFDMNRALLEREWILPKIDSLNSDVQKFDKNSDISAIVLLLFGEINIRFSVHDRSFSFMLGEPSHWTDFVFVIQKLYKDLFANDSAALSGDPSRNETIIAEMRRLRLFPKVGFPRKSKSKITNPATQIPLKLSRENAKWIESTEMVEYVRSFCSKLEKIHSQVRSNVESKELMVDDLFRA